MIPRSHLDINLLVDASLLRTPSGDEVQKLEAVLREDADARQQYLLACHVEGLLRARGAKSAPGTASLIPPERSFWQRSLPLLAVAAGLLIVVTAAKFLLVVGPQPQVVLASREATAPVAIVATLGNSEACHWEGEGEALTSGRHFVTGSALKLLSGVAQLTFETGAVLVMQGPCQLILEENAIKLHEGRVSAVVPRLASGFSVTTPTSEVIDLGTEFGVNVDSSGSTQVHVFSGEVVAHARNEQGQTVGSPLFVTTDNAIHFRPGTDAAERFEADEAAFVRWLKNRKDPLIDFTPPVEGRLLLWLSNGHWVLDEEQRVNVWRDTLSSCNRVAEDALQADPGARPRVIRNAIGEWPAVRFDGQNDCLITTPMASGDSQTIAMVATVDSRSHRLAQILNYNGPPQLATWEEQHPNILQIVAKVNQQQRVRILPFAYVGILSDRRVKVGAIRPDPVRSPEPDEPFVLTYLYDHVANHAELWMNNRSVGVNTAPSAIAVTSRKVVGRHGGFAHHFCGDIAEIMIFDEGLERSKINELNQELGAKYGISVHTSSQ